MRAETFAIALSLAFLVIVLTSIRRKRLQETQAVFWLSVGLVILVVSLTLPLHVLSWLARMLGVAYPPNILLVLSIIFLLVVSLRLAYALTEQSDKTRILAQELALLRAEADRRRAEGLGGLSAEEAAPEGDVGTVER